MKGIQRGETDSEGDKKGRGDKVLKKERQDQEEEDEGREEVQHEKERKRTAMESSSVRQGKRVGHVRSALYKKASMEALGCWNC